MSGLRPPVVVGLHPRAGTSTLAAVLHAHEGAGPAADIVCVGEHALPRTLALVAPLAGRRPVLAITAAPHSPPGGPPELASRFSAVVVVPHLAFWAGVPAPSEEIAMLLGLEIDLVPLPLRAYAAALRNIATAVVGSGLLGHGAPPSPLGPRAAGSPQPVPATHPNPAAQPAPTARPSPVAQPGTGMRRVPASLVVPAPLPRPLSRAHPAATPARTIRLAGPVGPLGRTTVAGPIPVALRRPVAAPARVRLQVPAATPATTVSPALDARQESAPVAHPCSLDPAGPRGPALLDTDPLDDDALEAAGSAATGRVG